MGAQVAEAEAEAAIPGGFLVLWPHAPLPVCALAPWAQQRGGKLSSAPTSCSASGVEGTVAQEHRAAGLLPRRARDGEWSPVPARRGAAMVSTY